MRPAGPRHGREVLGPGDPLVPDDADGLAGCVCVCGGGVSGDVTPLQPIIDTK